MLKAQVLQVVEVQTRGVSLPRPETGAIIWSAMFVCRAREMSNRELRSRWCGEHGDQDVLRVLLHLPLVSITTDAGDAPKKKNSWIRSCVPSVTLEHR